MGAIINQAVVQEMITHYQALLNFVPLRGLNSTDDYDNAVDSLNQLLDLGAADETHPLANLAHTLGTHIGEYETKQGWVT